MFVSSTSTRQARIQTPGPPAGRTDRQKERI